MAVGHNYLFSVIKSGNRVQLNRLKPSLLQDKVVGTELSEIAIYNFINDHLLRYRTLPTVDVLRNAGIEYKDTDQPPEYYLEELKKRRIYNAFKLFQKEVHPLLNNDFDAEQVVEAINRFSDEVGQINMSDKFKSIVEIGRELEGQIESRKQGNYEVVVPFGWETLDRLTGGLAGGDLAYFIARPGVGKTNILTYAAHHAWKNNFKPMLLTMEMTDIQISRRIYGLEGGFNPDAIRRTIPDSIVEQKLNNAIGSFDQGAPFHIICGQVKQTVETIIALVDELQPDVLYIDAAYLVSMSGPSKAAWEKIAAVSERLKQVAITRNIPIIMTVQFNREASKGKRYELDTIAGSDAIAQIASVIVSIREGADDHKDDRRILSILKNREGGIDEFEIHNRFDPPDFSEVTNNNQIDGDDDEQEFIP